MSKTTLRKRIAVVAVSALTAGVLSVVVAPAASANIAAQTTLMPSAGELKVATGSNTTGAPVVAASTSALSLGLLAKDATTSTAQTATVLAGGGLVLIVANAAATNTAFSATAGTFSNPGGAGTTTANAAKAVLTTEYGASNASLMLGSTDATSVAVLWNAPTTAGTYTVSGFRSTDATNFSTLATRGNGTNIGNITVTVVASAASDTPVPALSTCVTDTDGTLSSTADSTSIVQNGSAWYVNFLLRNAYVSPVSTNGNLVVTSSSADAVVSLGSGTHAAGTGTTVVQYTTGANASYDSVRVDQATSGKPVTTTITISYDGAVVCTKTVSIRGAADSMVFSKISSVKSPGSTANPRWIADASGRAGHFKVTLKDAAGNTVLPASGSEFSADAASLTTTVTAIAVASGAEASGLASADVAAGWDTSVGTFTCGPNAGSSKVKLKHTATATGKIITGEFTARCAGDAYTYTASFDKASYNQGEIATLTVKFLDSKGNPANSQTQVGASEMTLPMMTFVSATGAATTLTKEDGTLVYTLTVGTTTGLTAGTYTGIIDFTGLTAVAATKQNVTYKVGTGSQDITFNEVLKSVVALIASINKQIQALQKLILKR
jgi:hypothetical protein